jgi:hypothetical protein
MQKVVDMVYGFVDQGHRVVHRSTMDQPWGAGSALAGVGCHTRFCAKIEYSLHVCSRTFIPQIWTKSVHRIAKCHE